MWLRTMMNYQYRYGTSTVQAAKTLYKEGKEKKKKKEKKKAKGFAPHSWIQRRILAVLSRLLGCACAGTSCTLRRHGGEHGHAHVDELVGVDEEPRHRHQDYGCLICCRLFSNPLDADRRSEGNLCISLIFEVLTHPSKRRPCKSLGVCST